MIPRVIFSTYQFFVYLWAAALAQNLPFWLEFFPPQYSAPISTYHFCTSVYPYRSAPNGTTSTFFPPSKSFRGPFCASWCFKFPSGMQGGVLRPMKAGRDLCIFRGPFCTSWCFKSQLLMLYVDQVLVEGTGVSGCLQRIF